MHDGRKIQQWRQRLRIKQSDLAHLLCIPTQVLQAIENRKPVADSEFLQDAALKALREFEHTPIYDLAINARRLMHNTTGFIAGLQTVTDADTTIDFYRAKVEQAKARVRIVDGLKFVKGPLANESLFKVKFERGRHLDIYGRHFKLAEHVSQHYNRHPVITEVVAL